MMHSFPQTALPPGKYKDMLLYSPHLKAWEHVVHTLMLPTRKRGCARNRADAENEKRDRGKTRVVVFRAHLGEKRHSTVQGWYELSDSSGGY
jgi:hypothetical protein